MKESRYKMKTLLPDFGQQGSRHYFQGQKIASVVIFSKGKGRNLDIQDGHKDYQVLD